MKFIYSRLYGLIWLSVMYLGRSKMTNDLSIMIRLRIPKWNSMEFIFKVKKNKKTLSFSKLQTLKRI